METWYFNLAPDDFLAIRNETAVVPFSQIHSSIIISNIHQPTIY